MKHLLLAAFLIGIISSPKAQNVDMGKTVFDLLTGGAAYQNGKTWKIIDKPHFTFVGLYKTKKIDTSLYTYPDGLIGAEWVNGALTNSYTFTSDSVYKPLNQNVTANWLNANYYLGANQPKYQDVALVDPDHKEAKFSYVYTGNFFTGYNIKIQDNSYIGYFDKRHDYEIISITEDTLRLRHKFNDDPDSENFSNPLFDYTARLFTFVSAPLTALDEKNQGVEHPIGFYPNPSSGTIHIINRYTSTAIYNHLGELMLESDSKIINTSNLPSGVYQIKLSEKSGNVSWNKLIVN